MKTFNTTRSGFTQFNGMRFIKVGIVPKTEYDYESIGRLYRIQLFGGPVIQATPKEIGEKLYDIH